MKKIFGLLISILYFSNPALARTYYVSMDGNDSNSGTTPSLAWRNPQRCVAPTPLVAGDICEVANGTYSSASGYVVHTSDSSPSGITIKAANPGGALISIPNLWAGVDCTQTNCPFTGFEITQPNYTIDGFEIVRTGSYATSKTYVHAITFTGNSYGGTARRNKIHDLGRNMCIPDESGTISGISITGINNITIEENQFYKIGRLRYGENGCTSTRDNQDHGIYASGANIIVRRNLFYDVNRGYPIHFWGGTTTNLNIYHNTISGKSPTGYPAGQIMLGATIQGAYIANNISQNASYGMIATYALSASNIRVESNLTDTVANVGGSIPGISFSGNYERVADLGLDSNFQLKSGSVAINKGTTIGVPMVSDGKPDIGAYEYSSSITTAAPTQPKNLRVQ